MDELEHPSWCHRSHCTAVKPRPEYRAGETGYHRSAPVTVAVPSVGDMVTDAELNPVMAHLSQPAPPWDPVTMLNLGTCTDPEFVSLPVTQARTVLCQLDALLALGETATDAGPTDGSAVIPADGSATEPNAGPASA